MPFITSTTFFLYPIKVTTAPIEIRKLNPSKIVRLV
jgi:hypothetical protein